MRAGRDLLLFSFVPQNITSRVSGCMHVCMCILFVSVPLSRGVCVCVCAGADCSLFYPDGQSDCMCPGVSTAAPRNETPSAGVFTAMSMCCDVNEPSLLAPKNTPFNCPL